MSTINPIVNDSRDSIRHLSSLFYLFSYYVLFYGPLLIGNWARAYLSPSLPPHPDRFQSGDTRNMPGGYLQSLPNWLKKYNFSLLKLLFFDRELFFRSKFWRVYLQQVQIFGGGVNSCMYRIMCTSTFEWYSAIRRLEQIQLDCRLRRITLAVCYVGWVQSKKCGQMRKTTFCIYRYFFIWSVICWWWQNTFKRCCQRCTAYLISEDLTFARILSCLMLAKQISEEEERADGSLFLPMLVKTLGRTTDDCIALYEW